MAKKFKGDSEPATREEKIDLLMKYFTRVSDEARRKILESAKHFSETDAPSLASHQADRQ